MVGEACAHVRGSQGLKAHAAFPWLASQLPDHQGGERRTAFSNRRIKKMEAAAKEVRRHERWAAKQALRSEKSGGGFQFGRGSRVAGVLAILGIGAASFFGSGDDRGGKPAAATYTAKNFDETGVADLEKGLREQPWMEGYLCAIGVNPRTGPMPPLSPAETRCREIIQRGGVESPEVWKQELNACVADLRQEWLDSR
jgi:hypothetical protein